MRASLGSHSRSTADDALFRPVRAANAFEETVERLLQAVRLGVVAPGERLPSERELSTRLGVGRQRVREGLQALTQAGYLEVRRGRYGGTFVRAGPVAVVGGAPPLAPSVARPLLDLADVLTLRHVVETGSAEMAAAVRPGPGGRAHLLELLGQTTAAAPADYRRLDSRLHLAFAELTASPSLVAAVAEVRMRANDLLDAIPLLPTNIDHSNRQHARLVAAIVDGEPGRARTEMAEHLEGTAMLLRGFLLG